MYTPKEATDIAQLQQENAELKLRVQRLETHLDLSNAPQKSTGVHVAHGKMPGFERTNNAARKVLLIFEIFVASFFTLIALYVTIHIFIGHIFIVKDFPGQGPTGDFRPISNANYPLYVRAAAIAWFSAALWWSLVPFTNWWTQPKR